MDQGVWDKIRALLSELPPEERSAFLAQHGLSDGPPGGDPGAQPAPAAPSTTDLDIETARLREQVKANMSRRPGPAAPQQPPPPQAPAVPAAPVVPRAPVHVPVPPIPQHQVHENVHRGPGAPETGPGTPRDAAESRNATSAPMLGRQGPGPVIVVHERPSPQPAPVNTNGVLPNGHLGGQATKPNQPPVQSPVITVVERKEPPHAFPGNAKAEFSGNGTPVKRPAQGPQHQMAPAVPKPPTPPHHQSFAPSLAESNPPAAPHSWNTGHVQQVVPVKQPTIAPRPPASTGSPPNRGPVATKPVPATLARMQANHTGAHPSAAPSTPAQVSPQLSNAQIQATLQQVQSALPKTLPQQVQQKAATPVLSAAAAPTTPAQTPPPSLPTPVAAGAAAKTVPTTMTSKSVTPVSTSALVPLRPTFDPSSADPIRRAQEALIFQLRTELDTDFRDITRVESEVDKEVNEFKAREAEVETHKQEAAKLAQRLEELQNEVLKVRSELAEHNGTLTAQQKLVSYLGERVTSKKEELAGLRAAVSVKKLQLKNLGVEWVDEGDQQLIPIGQGSRESGEILPVCFERAMTGNSFLTRAAQEMDRQPAPSSPASQIPVTPVAYTVADIRSMKSDERVGERIDERRRDDRRYDDRDRFDRDRDERSRERRRDDRDYDRYDRDRRERDGAYSASYRDAYGNYGTRSDTYRPADGRPGDNRLGENRMDSYRPNNSTGDSYRPMGSNAGRARSPGPESDPKRRRTNEPGEFRAMDAFAEQICVGWNSTGCFSQSCRFKHVCSKCKSADHSAVECMGPRMG